MNEYSRLIKEQLLGKALKISHISFIFVFSKINKKLFSFLYN